MHYDEYDISMGKEINFCRRVIKDLKNDLLKRERRFGMTTEQFLMSSGAGLPADQTREMDRWREDHRQLQEWEERLRAYEEALAGVKSQI